MAFLFQGVHAMMGQQKDYQQKIFITDFNLEKRVPKDHLLRKIQEQIDFDFIYKEVKHAYGVKGNVSVEYVQRHCSGPGPLQCAE